EQVVRLAAQQNLPAIYQYREFAKLGGLSSYGTDLIDSYRQAGVYSGRVLKGEKPGDLPRAASDQIRSRHQSQDRKSAQPDNFARGVGDYRRSDRNENASCAIREFTPPQIVKASGGHFLNAAEPARHIPQRCRAANPFCES